MPRCNPFLAEPSGVVLVLRRPGLLEAPMRHVTRSWQATMLSGSAEYRGAKHTVQVDRWLRVSAQKVSLASVDLPDRSHVAVTTR